MERLIGELSGFLLLYTPKDYDDVTRKFQLLHTVLRVRTTRVFSFLNFVNLG